MYPDFALSGLSPNAARYDLQVAIHHSLSLSEGSSKAQLFVAALSQVMCCGRLPASLSMGGTHRVLKTLLGKLQVWVIRAVYPVDVWRIGLHQDLQAENDESEHRCIDGSATDRILR